MFDRFTDRARKVMGLSRQECQRFHHDYIGTEHLLLGLIREEEGFAARALRTLDVGLEAARREVAKLLAAEVPVPEVPGPQVSGPLTDRARRVMRIAGDEAARLRHAEIGTEHILLGLIGEVAPGVLSKVLLLRLRVETEKLMTPGTEPVPKPTFTPGAKKAIKLALEAAHDLGPGGAGPEHLLLGLIGEKEGLAARVLSAAGITAGEVLEAIAPARKPPATGLFWLDRLGDRSRRAMALAREEPCASPTTTSGPSTCFLASLRRTAMRRRC